MIFTIETSDLIYMEISPVTIYVESWVTDSSKDEDLYYSSTFTSTSFDIDILNPCVGASIVESNSYMVNTNSDE